MKAKPMNDWVVGDFKKNGRTVRKVLKRKTRKNRFGLKTHTYWAQDNRRGIYGYVMVSPVKVSRLFATQAQARLRKRELEGRV